MMAKYDAQNYNDALGNPSGGYVKGTGLDIVWQNGPLGRGEARIEPNGAFVETVIDAARQRLEYYQTSKFNSTYNAEAIEYLNKALAALDQRTKDREAAGVEGTHANPPVAA